MSLGSKHVVGTRLRTGVGGASLTKQSFKDECDINNVMKRFERTGAIEHLAKYGPQYADVMPVDFQQAMNTVALANSMWEELPVSVKQRVGSPEGFLEFVNDPGNGQELVELGLAVSAPVVPVVAPAGPAVPPVAPPV